MHKSIVKILLLSIITITLTTLCSCYDLGSYNQGYTTIDGTRTFKTDYYDYFSEIRIYKNFESQTFSMDKFYNEVSYSDSAIADNCPLTSTEAYQAIVIPVSKDIEVGEFYFFIQASLINSTTSDVKSCSIDTTFYVSESDLSIVEESDNTLSEETKKKYAVSGESTSFTINASNEFKSVSVKFPNASSKKLKKGNYLIFLFNNNIENDLNNCYFRFTNILISNKNAQ